MGFITTLRIAKLLPKTIIAACAMQVLAEATSGKYGSTLVSELSAMDAIKRYDKEHNIN